MIFYLHGFRSAPSSWKARALHDHLAAWGRGDEFWCEPLPVSPEAVKGLVQGAVLKSSAPSVFVGSSLGGFYATWFAERYDARAVLVNPLVPASKTLEDWIGEHENLYTGERFTLTQAHIKALREMEDQTRIITRPERYRLLVETGDEVLDYRQAVSHYSGAVQTVLPGGNHSFTWWKDYLDDVVAFADAGS